MPSHLDCDRQCGRTRGQCGRTRGPASPPGRKHDASQFTVTQLIQRGYHAQVSLLIVTGHDLFEVNGYCAISHIVRLLWRPRRRGEITGVGGSHCSGVCENRDGWLVAWGFCG